MKTYTIFLYLIIYSLFLLGCDDTPAEQHTISVMIDRSEPDAVLPSSESILKALPERQLSDGLELSFTNFSETYFNKRQSFILDKGEVGWLANDDKRRKQFKLLYKKFKDSLSNSYKQAYGFDKSYVFRTLSKELIYLASKEGYREIWLYSDLKEHSFFSVYDDRSKRKLFSNISSVASQFELAVNLPKDLSGITVRVIYQPMSQDAELFSKLIELYKIILEPRGAIVMVGLEQKIRI